MSSTFDEFQVMVKKNQFDVLIQSQEIIENFHLVQRIDFTTRKGTKIIDHTITNIPNKLLYFNVLPCTSINDHDTP